MNSSGIPDVGDTVLYVTHKPHPGGGAILTRIPALVTALGEDGSIEITAFPPGCDPCFYRDVSRSQGGRYGGWEPRGSPGA